MSTRAVSFLPVDPFWEAFHDALVELGRDGEIDVSVRMGSARIVDHKAPGIEVVITRKARVDAVAVLVGHDDDLSPGSVLETMRSMLDALDKMKSEREGAR